MRMIPGLKRKQKEIEVREAKEEKERINQEIYRYAEELETEMNLRMVLLQNNTKEILFVDSISVATISYPHEKEKTGFCKRLFLFISQMVMKTLQNIKKEGRKLLWQ